MHRPIWLPAMLLTLCLTGCGSDDKSSSSKTDSAGDAIVTDLSEAVSEVGDAGKDVITDLSDAAEDVKDDLMDDTDTTTTTTKP